jgi:hypothetical protein
MHRPPRPRNRNRAYTIQSFMRQQLQRVPADLVPDLVFHDRRFIHTDTGEKRGAELNVWRRLGALSVIWPGGRAIASVYTITS